MRDSPARESVFPVVFPVVELVLPVHEAVLYLKESILPIVKFNHLLSVACNARHNDRTSGAEGAQLKGLLQENGRILSQALSSRQGAASSLGRWVVVTFRDKVDFWRPTDALCSSVQVSSQTHRRQRLSCSPSLPV